MANYSITFKSLRAGTTYTVNIGGSSGSAIPLKGGAEPFTTQEDDSDDPFAPIRTQSGYIRIFDNGLAADGVTPFDWRDLLPMTDTDRPVTLTDDGGNIVWQGFMQAQNFGGVLYGNPQEREFPVQCALTVTECNDIDVNNHEMRNFAWLLNNIISSIPHISITRVVVQGGSDARQWLLKMIDWQNLVQVDADDVVVARYNHYQCLEDMCRFWGWTARTYGQTLYLMRPDDADEQTFLTLTLTELATLAGGEIAGTTSGTWSTAAIGNEFASVANHDYQLRGPNKATVTSDGNAASDTIAGFADEVTSKAMEDLGWGQLQKRMVFIDGKDVWPSAWGEDGGWFQYTNDLMSFSRPYLTGECQTGKAAFCKMSSFDDGQGRQDGDTYDVIVIKQPYASGAAAYATLKSVYHHAFSDGIFQLKGTIYRRGNKLEATQKNLLENIGRFTMRMRLGIGKTRASATWWNGASWTTTMSDFAVAIGNKDDILRTVYSSGRSTLYRDTITVGSASGMSGQLFVEFLGSEDMPDIDGSRDFDIEGFALEFTRTSQRRTSSGTTSTTTGNFGGRANYADIERSDRREYKSKNTSNVRMEWNADCIYASDNDMSFGFGVLSNPDPNNTYVTTITYGSRAMFAEQHQADRVTAYWATAKREIDVELLSHIIADISPMHKVTLDGSSLYPFAIGRNWRDDVTRITLIEL